MSRTRTGALVAILTLLALAACAAPAPTPVPEPSGDSAASSTSTPQPTVKAVPSFLGSAACDGLRPVLADGGNTVAGLSPADFPQTLGVPFPRVPDCVLELTFVSGRPQIYFVWGGVDAAVVAGQMENTLVLQGFEKYSEVQAINSDDDSMVTYLRRSDAVAIVVYQNLFGQEGLVAVTTSE